MKIEIVCQRCGKKFQVYPCYYWIKYCSKECRYQKGIATNTGKTWFKKGEPQPKNAHKWAKGHPNYNLECSDETREKLKGRIPWNKDKKLLYMSGKNHWNWISDRNKLKKRQERNDSAYWVWAMSIKKRDNWKCRINNKDCSGKVIAHHILPWRDFPELRYEINNGITLCQAHHPRKRAEEKRLIPFFQGLVSVSNELNCF